MLAIVKPLLTTCTLSYHLNVLLIKPNATHTQLSRSIPVKGKLAFLIVNVAAHWIRFNFVRQSSNAMSRHSQWAEILWETVVVCCKCSVNGAYDEQQCEALIGPGHGLGSCKSSKASCNGWVGPRHLRLVCTWFCSTNILRMWECCKRRKGPCTKAIREWAVCLKGRGGWVKRKAVERRALGWLEPAPSDEVEGEGSKRGGRDVTYHASSSRTKSAF